jgi:hypothetical protein
VIEWRVGSRSADPGLFNVVINAVTHAAVKQVQVTAQGLGLLVVLRVTNQGTPIPFGLQQSIFDSFAQPRNWIACEFQRISYSALSACEGPSVVYIVLVVLYTHSISTMIVFSASSRARLR